MNTMANKQLEHRTIGQKTPEDILVCDEELSPFLEEEEEGLPCSQISLCSAIRVDTGSLSKDRCVLNLADPHDLAILTTLLKDSPSPGVLQEEAAPDPVQIVRTTRTQLGGLVWIVLKFLFQKGSLDLTEADFDELVNSSVHITELTEAVPIILLTVQTVATTPQINRILRKWAEGLENVVGLELTPDSTSLVKLKPWDGPQFWSFEAWARAAEVVARFLIYPEIPLEDEFRARIAEVREEAGTQGWTVPIMAATLFGIRKATWLWRLLDANDHTPDV